MGRLNDTYTDRNWAEDPPSDSSQNASRQQLYTNQTQNTSSQSLCAVSFIFHMEFPSDVLFSWLSCWGGSNPWNYRPVSFLPSLCHSGVATVINVVREPQGALTLQPYLWLASWNEHSPHCTCTQTLTHTLTHTHLSPEAWRSPVEHVCQETGPSGPPGNKQWQQVIQSLRDFIFHTTI